MKKPFRVEICGGIAVGKTSLAKCLVDVFSPDADLVLEEFEENPFWGKFYTNPTRYAVEKNICFLAQHTAALKDILSNDFSICDYAVLQDLAYARLYADPAHFDTMFLVFQHLYSPLGWPSVLVYLQCSVETQLSRINSRARPAERGISSAYLLKLNQAIEQVIARVKPRTEVVIISTEHIALSDVQALVSDRITSLRGAMTK
jgi:deoxyguanosine kinase